jgi:DNA/RNA endonuclease YhcR with UshA esterase domain
LVKNILPKDRVEDAAMSLSPLEAANRVSEQVTVQMVVNAAKNCQHCSQIFLDSEVDHRDSKNLAVTVTETGKPKFKDIGINDPVGHFKGKLIRVTGVVTLKDNRPQIEVDDPRQIEVVAKDK